MNFHSHITYGSNFQETKNKEISLDLATTVVTLKKHLRE